MNRRLFLDIFGAFFLLRMFSHGCHALEKQSTFSTATHAQQLRNIIEHNACIKIKLNGFCICLAGVASLQAPIGKRFWFTAKY